MSTVVFDYDEFISKFYTIHLYNAVNEGKLTEAQITDAFNYVASWLKADDSSMFPYDPEKGVTTRKDMLYLALCHVLTLSLWGANGQGGRIASASQGSVSTSFDLIKTNKFSSDWWNQTQCGQMYYKQFQPYAKGGKFYTPDKYHPYG